MAFDYMIVGAGSAGRGPLGVSDPAVSREVADLLPEAADSRARPLAGQAQDPARAVRA